MHGKRLATCIELELHLNVHRHDHTHTHIPYSYNNISTSSISTLYRPKQSVKNYFTLEGVTMLDCLSVNTWGGDRFKSKGVVTCHSTNNNERDAPAYDVDNRHQPRGWLCTL